MNGLNDGLTAKSLGLIDEVSDIKRNLSSLNYLANEISEILFTGQSKAESEGAPISTPDSVSFFVGQIRNESNELRETLENILYKLKG